MAPSRVVLESVAGTSGVSPGPLLSDEHAATRTSRTAARKPRIPGSPEKDASTAAARVPETAGQRGGMATAAGAVLGHRESFKNSPVPSDRPYDRPGVPRWGQS